MSPTLEIFKTFNQNFKSRIMIDNKGYLDVQGKGTYYCSTLIGIKCIINILFVPNIN
uniref:Uncharacterized protein n=1 Tax=Rhizophora mucronata TaxID=61149 RepID=A0A2P2N4I3_RHIMU